jgi:predicted phosphodiesterase
MPRREPTLAELEILASSQSITEAKQALNAGTDTIRRWIEEHGVSPGNPLADVPRTTGLPGTGKPEHWDIPASATFQNGMWSLFEQLQQEMDKLDTEVDEITVNLPDDKPVLISVSSDWHVGHTQTDMPALRQDLEAIKNNDGFYTILLGDLLDNVSTSVASRGMHHQQLHPVRIQKELVDEAVHFLGREKVLAMVLGNHENWSISADDFDPVEYLARKLGAPYLGAFGHININLGSERYRILAAHMFRMRSSFNKTHQAKRLKDFVGTGLIDAVFTGHTHDSASEETYSQNHRTFFGQAGTYQKHSRYSKQLGFTASTQEMPGVVLWPDKHKIFGIHDSMTDGPLLLEAFRAKYK